MVALTLRADKGAPLTHDEVDENFQNLSDAIDALGSGGGRELLTANRTYYLRTDGNNSNDGLSNTSGGAWLTLQHAYDFVANNLDLGGFTVTIQVAAGTYAGGIAYNFNAPPIVNGTFYVRGDPIYPRTVIFQSNICNVSLNGKTSMCCNGIQAPAFLCFNNPNQLTVGSGPNFTDYGDISISGSGAGLNIDQGGNLLVNGGIHFNTSSIANGIYIGANSQATIYLFYLYAFINCNFTYACVEARYGGKITYFNCGAIYGTFTGPRMAAGKSSFILTENGTQSLAAGNSDGTIDATSSLESYY